MRKLPHLLFLCLALATVRKTNAHRPRVEASVVQPRPTLTNTTTTAHQQYSVRSSRSLLASHDCVNCSFPLLLHIKKTDEDSVVAELMSYLITFTSGTQFYLVYDDLLPDSIMFGVWSADIGGNQQEELIPDLEQMYSDFQGRGCWSPPTITGPSSRSTHSTMAPSSPFLVWICICVVTALVGPVLYVVSHIMIVYVGKKDHVHHSMQSLSFNMYRNLMVQNIDITSLTGAFVSSSSSAMYSGTLTAVLAVPAFEKPIDSLEHLAQAHHDGYTIVSGIYHEVWKLFNHKDRDQSFLSTPASGFDMILKQKYVYINAQLNSELIATQQGRANYYIARETFLPQGYGIACSSGSPFKEVFSNILLRLTEAGLVYKWADNEVNKVAKNNSPTSETGPTAIKIQHLQAAFFMLVIGFATSAAVFGGEIVASRLRQNDKTTKLMEKASVVKDWHFTRKTDVFNISKFDQMLFLKLRTILHSQEQSAEGPGLFKQSLSMQTSDLHSSYKASDSHLSYRASNSFPLSKVSDSSRLCKD
ncbi:Glutamate receptor ionotropic, delta-1-like 26 [Homarus americanus]|uniref:Glutamate receptor ionotropic, delta-1-like 26 n=1 Tax=Homarus americanus TaxID=6706 RepID=A0A8J5THW5_HOMAM|nr:Glutamate receptor ionotropic, delta-1-like 26 [Homarus americanus]